MGKRLSLREQVKQLELDKARMVAELQELRRGAAREEALKKQVESLTAKLATEQRETARLQGHLDGIREQLDRAVGKPPLIRGDLPRFPVDLTKSRWPRDIPR